MIRKSQAVPAPQEGSCGRLSEQLGAEMPFLKLTWALATCCPCATGTTGAAWLGLETRGQAPPARAHLIGFAL